MVFFSFIQQNKFLQVLLNLHILIILLFLFNSILYYFGFFKFLTFLQIFFFSYTIILFIFFIFTNYFYLLIKNIFNTFFISVHYNELLEFKLVNFLESIIMLNVNFFKVNWISLYFNLITSFKLFFINFIDNINLYFIYPWMVYGLLILFVLVFSSFFYSNYLGLYGNFLSIIFGLFVCWFSFIFYFKLCIVEGGVFFITFGNLWNFYNIVPVQIDLYIDFISTSFSILVLSIALPTAIVAFIYFRYEPLITKFISLIASFVISMLILVCFGNLIILLLGWELIGITSFLLINFWTTRSNTLKAAFKAYSFNKFSDFNLIIYIILLVLFIGSFNLVVILSKLSLYQYNYIHFLGFKVSYILLVGLALLGSAVVKSAQLGFHIWLPDSMEAPVPASALIHSATLVSAGVFLIIRFFIIFKLNSTLLVTLGLWGSITAFYGGFIAIYQTDVKRLLAYSTISHCGFLFVLCHFGDLVNIFFYLYIHGFFKACSFLILGNIIRISQNNQDLKYMGNFYKILSFECFSLLICCLNLGGLPYTYGFFIKHLLLNNVIQYNFYNLFILVNCFFGALFGLIYMYKLYINIFFTFYRGFKVNFINNFTDTLYKNFSGTPKLFLVLISVLIFFGYFFGFLYYFLTSSICLDSYVNITNMLFNTSSVLNIYSNLYNGKFFNILILAVYIFLNYTKYSNFYSFLFLKRLMNVLVIAIITCVIYLFLL